MPVHQRQHHSCTSIPHLPLDILLSVLVVYLSMRDTFTERLRQAIRDSGMTRYAISVQTGIAQSTLCKFIKGERGMSLDSVDRLMECLGLEIKQVRKRKECIKMASFRQHGKNGKIWYYRYMDASGKQVERKGHWDFKTTQAMARKAEDEAAKIRNGLVDPKDAAYVRHESKPLADHIAEWQAALVSKGFTAKHAEHTSNRVRRLVAVILNAEVGLSDHRKIPPKDRGKFVKNIAEASSPPVCPI